MNNIKFDATPIDHTHGRTGLTLLPMALMWKGQNTFLFCTLDITEFVLLKGFLT